MINRCFKAEEFSASSPPFIEAVCGLENSLKSFWAYQTLNLQCLSTLLLGWPPPLLSKPRNWRNN